MALLIGLFAGVLGGILLGLRAGHLSFGRWPDGWFGLLGGALGSSVLNRIGAPEDSGGVDLAMVLGQSSGGLAGGAVLVAVAGAVRNATKKENQK